MIIFIELKKLRLILLMIAVLILLGFGIRLWNSPIYIPIISVYEPYDNQLITELKNIFEYRNQALLNEDIELLASLYSHDVQNGVWAYEHELSRLKYLHSWSDKQGVKFTEINSYIDMVDKKEKDEGFFLTLLVSTEYKYVYEDNSQIENIFRIGAYHYLDLIPNNDRLIITKEWYQDPFADSLHLDENNTEDIKNIILSGKAKNFSDLNERRINAVNYADKYCGAASLPEYGFKYNPDYRNFNSLGGDCTNFASQVLHEGGGFSKNASWNYENGSASKAWVNASTFNNYMLYSGRASKIAYGTYNNVLKYSYELLPGDYIAYEKDGEVKHISIVTDVDSKGYSLVNSHNSDRYRVPWDLGWSNKDIRFWLVRVHY